MSDLQSSIAKGVLATLCSILAMVAAVASARLEARNAATPPLGGAEFSASRLS